MIKNRLIIGVPLILVLIAITNSDELNTGFQEYYDHYVDLLMEQADIQTDIK